MEETMPWPVKFILIALILYTTAIWSERLLKKGLKSWMVIVFGSGLTFDVVGTSLMMLRVSQANFNAHELSGITALIIMALHFVWAGWALKKHGRTEHYFHKFSLFAWGVWIMALLTGYLPR